MTQRSQDRSTRGRASLSAAAAAIDARPATTRWLLAGPGAVLATLATMMAAPVWLPAGSAGVNHLAFPILLAPLIWSVPFFYACLEENLPRGAAVIVGATLAQGVVAAMAMAGG